MEAPFATQFVFIASLFCQTACLPVHQCACGGVCGLGFVAVVVVVDGVVVGTATGGTVAGGNVVFCIFCTGVTGTEPVTSCAGAKMIGVPPTEGVAAAGKVVVGTVDRGAGPVTSLSGAKTTP